MMRLFFPIPFFQNSTGVAACQKCDSKFTQPHKRGEASLSAWFGRIHWRNSRNFLPKVQSCVCKCAATPLLIKTERGRWLAGWFPPPLRVGLIHNVQSWVVCKGTEAVLTFSLTLVEAHHQSHKFEAVADVTCDCPLAGTWLPAGYKLGSGFNCHENRFFFLGWGRDRIKGWPRSPHMTWVRLCARLFVHVQIWKLFLALK